MVRVCTLYVCMMLTKRHVLKSVFEGTLTPKQFSTLKEELHKVTSDEDSVLFYFSYNEKQIYKEGLNKVNESLNILID